LPAALLLVIPLLSSGQEKPPVADMHYHISMKAYNNYGLDLLKGVPVNKKWIEERRDKGLKIRYNGYWVRAKATNSHLRNYTQATLPHTQDGNVRLAFNAITPFEYTLNDEFFDRLFSKYFKTHARMKWLKSIGDWKTLTHFDSYKRELAMLCQQESKDTVWMFWRGKERTMDPAKTYVVNVLEGSHTLQHKKFRPDLQFDPLTNEDFGGRYIKGLRQDIKAKRKEEMKRQQQADDPITREQRMEKRQSSRDEKDTIEMVEDEVEKVAQMAPGQDVDVDSIAPIITSQSMKILAELDSTISLIKTNDPPVFMVTVGHLAFNGMIGHAPALDGNRVARVLLRKFFRTRVSNDRIWQKNWEDKFYSPPAPTRLGMRLLKNLLDSSRTNGGHRIYIDLKHSGYPTRKWFYKLSYDSMQKGDTIPPICSHCAASGLSDLHYSITTDEYAYADSKGVQNFYPLSINLYDEEIATICELDGIIGITLEERVLGGYMKNPVPNDTVKAAGRRKENLKKLDKLRRDKRLNILIDSVQEEAARKPYYYALSDKEAFRIICEDYLSLEPFMQNLFYIIDKSKKGNDAWNHLCIGSDLDGLVDPLDIIPTASQYPYFRNRLKQLTPIYLEIRDNDPLRWKAYFDDEQDIDKKLNQLFYESLSKFVVKYFRK
jgi:hypothetical protein